jgi:hypothetical protein
MKKKYEKKRKRDETMMNCLVKKKLLNSKSQNMLHLTASETNCIVIVVFLLLRQFEEVYILFSQLHID